MDSCMNHESQKKECWDRDYSEYAVMEDLVVVSSPSMLQKCFHRLTLTVLWMYNFYTKA